MSGRVILVGAGPGAADLITVRGRDALRRADVVVYDALASNELLELAPESAQRINVGKRGHDDPTRPQPQTNEILVALAREGKTVVRLKGGDPFVFGRGGEECTACAEAGVPFEVVPGISSVVGALAYAGIPLTDRRHGASFAVVTGHKDPTKVSAETRWDALATSADTLVVLMAMRNLEEIVAKVLAGGRSPATPAAVVMDGTLPTQRVVEAPLGDLARVAREAGLGAPSVVVIGDVVELRGVLAWYERQPLFGVRVLVTRPAAQADELVWALRAAGAAPVPRPMIRVGPPADWAPADAALDALGRYDALVFTSTNGVRALAARAAERGLALAGAVGLPVFCVGPKTAEAAAEAGLPLRPLPPRRDAEGLLAEIRRALPPEGRRYLLPCAAGAREVLPDGLRADGATVDVAPVYRTVPADVDAAELCDRLASGGLDVLTFASPSAVERFDALLDDAARTAARRCLVAAIGPVTAEALRRVGLAAEVAPDRAGATELVAALAERIAGRRGGAA